MSKLTQKQETFCLEYLKDGNATRAYKVAYDAEKMKESSINVNACKLLKDTKIAQRLNTLGEKHTKEKNITVEKIVNELAAIAFVSVDDFYNDNGEIKNFDEMKAETKKAVSSYRVKRIKVGEEFVDVPAFNSHDKLKALELLGKTLAMFTDKNITDLKSDGPLFQINLKRD